MSLPSDAKFDSWSDPVAGDTDYIAIFIGPDGERFEVPEETVHDLWSDHEKAGAALWDQVHAAVKAHPDAANTTTDPEGNTLFPPTPGMDL